MPRPKELKPVRKSKAVKSRPHPMQPVEWDGDGVVRFKSNAIVRYLLDNGGLNMNDLAVLDFTQEDQVQFAQLIGYSVSGFGDLSYAEGTPTRRADAAVRRLLKEQPEEPNPEYHCKQVHEE